jgi:hypothetical protein
MQIGGKGIENFLVHLVLGKKTSKRNKLKKTPFHASLLENWLSKF